MSKSTSLSLLVLGLLLFASFTQGTRPVPAQPMATTEQQPLVATAEEQMEATPVERCGDECMMRRTLEAHLDYIYTQEKKH
ncbi:hypothetical protein Taro_037378 [Colocasia esculenta]|uniref:Phytosulfokine n=1 Tax=Colocasia esculenta TaxID=4460 RepID=A0A843W9K6_COLES|nr:hypothetical protein [Colocasia esculenta]